MKVEGEEDALFYLRALQPTIAEQPRKRGSSALFFVSSDCLETDLVGKEAGGIRREGARDAGSEATPQRPEALLPHRVLQAIEETAVEKETAMQESKRTKPKDQRSHETGRRSKLERTDACATASLFGTIRLGFDS